MGIISTAGALAGAGQGITEAGQQQQKIDLATKVNQLAQDRDEAMERLRAAHETERQNTQIQAQKDIQSTGQTFEKEQTQTKLTAASKAASATREFEHTENAAREAAGQKRAETLANARVEAARVTAGSRVEAKGPPKIWEPVKLNQGGFDPVSHLPTSNQLQISYNHFTGRSYAQVGDKMIPWDASTNKPATDPKSIRRAPVEDLQDLTSDPLGTVPKGGPNAGLSKAEVFEAAHGYLPASWTSAANRKAAANPQQYSSLFSAPYAAVKGGGADDSGAADNAAQAQEDASDSAPPFQSSAMQNYNANAQ
jgi:hypothetical protein